MKYIILIFLIPQIVFAEKYLLIKDGKVVNRIEADQGFADKISSDFDFVKLIDSTNKDVNIGFSYDGSIFSAPPKPPKPPKTEAEIAIDAYKADMETKKDRLRVWCDLQTVDSPEKDQCELILEDR